MVSLWRGRGRGRGQEEVVFARPHERFGVRPPTAFLLGHHIDVFESVEELGAAPFHEGIGHVFRLVGAGVGEAAARLAGLNCG